jgi:hypothetical protein
MYIFHQPDISLKKKTTKNKMPSVTVNKELACKCKQIEELRIMFRRWISAIKKTGW